jgi:branched-chain amino acid transport system substrate-binding protein
MVRLYLYLIVAVFITIASIASGAEIEIGLASNFSEPTASSSNPFGNYFRQGVQLAIQSRKTELDEKQIKILLKEFDYGTRHARVLEAAKAATQSNVVAVIGYNLSSDALLAAPIHQKARLPFITPSATADRVGTFGPYVHQACFDNAFMSKTLANIANQRLKAKKVTMVVAADCAYCQDLARGFKKEFYKINKIEPKEILTLENETQFDPVIQKVRAQLPEVILLPNQELLSARVIAALTRAGIKVTYLGGDGWGNVGDEFEKIVGNLDFQAFSLTHWHEDIDTEASHKFIKDYMQTYGKKPNDMAVLAYDSMKLLIQAILQSPSLTRQGIEDSLNRIKTFDGVTGSFVYSGKRSPEKSLVLIKKEKEGFAAVTTLHPI